MKLEAFSEVSNLVRHLEGLEARKAQLAELIATDAATNYIIDIQQKQTDAQGETYYACKAFMQSHDADAPFASVEILIAALLERLEQRITVVKIKLRDLGVNLDDNPHAELDKRIDRVMSRKAHDLQNIESPSKEMLS